MAAHISFDLLASLVSASLIYVIYKRMKSKALPLPPGPKGYPIVGNLFDLPRQGMGQKCHEWAQLYGSDIIHLNVMGQSVIVLDTKEATTELMDRRSSIYSSRPSSPMIMDLMGFDFNFSMMGYGDKWRTYRRLAHESFHHKAAQSFRPHNFRAARNLLRRFLERPKDIAGNLRYMAGETIISITYGLEVQPNDDPYINTAEDSVRVIAENAKPGSNLVDLLPILKYVPEWMPGATFHAQAKQARTIARKSLEMPFRAAKARIDQGNYMPSFISRCYSKIGEQVVSDREEYIIKGTAASLYLAGSDTTTHTILCCIAALLDNPGVIKQAQQEIDSVIPFGELPTFDDEDRLPFITAMTLETLRWKELLPIGFPHLLTDDDIYKGYRIPRGSIVFGNAWAMLHDEKFYPDPSSFNPSRFMKDGKLDPDVRDPGHAAFGFGRRICLGRYMALSAVWITLASLLAAFDIEKSVDANGKVIEVTPNLEHFHGLVRSPAPYECSIKPRSAKHVQAIRADLDIED